MNIIPRPANPTNYDRGRIRSIDRITFHHIVGDAPGGTDHFRTAGVEVSSTYAISSNGTIYQYVQEGDTPYTDGNYDSNSRSITIEHAGGHPDVPYTEAMYKASIELVAFLIQKYGINDFQRHRDVIDKRRYPGGTACPGQLDVERIVSEAKQGGNMPTLVDGNITNLEYDAMLHRHPEGPQVYTAWQGQPVTNMQEDIRKSQEWKDFAPNKGDLTNYYQQVIGKDPTPDDINYHLNRFSDGAGEAVGSWKNIVYDSFKRNDFLPNTLKKQNEDLVKENEALKKQLGTGGSGLDQTTKDQITETNSIVKWIKDLLGRVFK